MRQYNFYDGELILQEGDPSDFVYRILFGEVEIFTERNGETIVLGAVKAGDFLGEMGIIERRPRSASARANGPVTAEKLEHWEFVNLISDEPVAAHRLIDRLSQRLRSANNRLAQTAVPGASTTKAVSEQETTQAASTEARVSIFAGSDRLASCVPDSGLAVTKFPFTVGRRPDVNEAGWSVTVDLPVPDTVPYRMSCPHFVLRRSADGYAVRDLGSRLGTQVNDVFVGENFDHDVQPLRVGTNTIVAGGIDSPYRFTIVVGGA